MKEEVQETKNKVGILEEKLEKGCSSDKENDYQKKHLHTAESALEWTENNLVEERVEYNRGTPCCTKAICGLGGCGKTSAAIEFAWKYLERFPGGVFWING